MMYLFQFGLQTQPDPVRAVAQGDLFVAGVILWVMFGLALFVGSLFLMRFILRRLSLAKQATFRRVTLLVTLPKFRREEESERGPTKDQVKEAISAAETFFSGVGGLKAQYGLRVWLLGRHDEFSFEIVVEKKLIKFYVSAPVELREFVEQQLSAAYPDAYTEEVEDYNIFQPDGFILGSHLVFRRQNFFPIKTYTELEKDPLNAITNVLSKIPEGDGAAFQFLVRSSYGKWRKQGVRIATNMMQGMNLEEAIKGKKKSKSSLADLAGFGGDKPKEPEKDYR
ncbi:MAG: hypothetical protein NUV84_05725, partial [Candidatus Uhrbacteria bacterium]|nr:hypothetical protein [Candidatus Uhrbacteria bacterium]